MKIVKGTFTLATLAGLIGSGFVAPHALAQQTMKVSNDGMGGGVQPGGAGIVHKCLPVPPPPIVNRTATPSNSSDSGRPANPTPSTKLTLYATTSWQITSAEMVRYCVHGGVANVGATASSAPLTLLLTDARKIDKDYQKDYAKSPNSMPKTHQAAPPQQGIISLPIAAGGSTLLSEKWCSTVEWKKRPHLYLQLSGGGAGQQARCEIVFSNAPG